MSDLRYTGVVSGTASFGEEWPLIMTNDSQVDVDDLLDAWEEHVSRDPEFRLDQFLADRCVGLAPSLVDAFRKRALALAAIDLRLRAINRIDIEVATACFGRYTARHILGEGGSGVVYLGYDSQLHRDVAIKVPRQRRIKSARDAEAYLNEARTLASLDHPGIVPVYDVGKTADGICYIVSKHVSRGNLAKLVASELPPREKFTDLIIQVAEALHYAHNCGLVHRDVKPANILIDETGRPMLADFGLAISVEEYGRGSSHVGTPAYMSPEQARGEGHRVDARTDIYSLGVVFYELLTGRSPYRSTRMPELGDEIISGETRPPRQLDDTIPQELDRICLKALAKRASDRYSTALDLATDLRCWQAQRSGRAVERRTDEFGGPKPDFADAPSTLRSSAATSPEQRRRVRGRKVGIAVASCLTAIVCVVQGLRLSSESPERRVEPGPLAMASRLAAKARQSRSSAQSNALRQESSSIHDLQKLEDETRSRTTQDLTQRAADARVIAAALDAHRERHQRVIDADRRDARYFASLLVVAAHTGLLGQPDEERKLLVDYWQQFSEAVAPEKCLEVGDRMKKLLAEEARFFQDTVDSGIFGLNEQGPMTRRKDDVEYFRLYLKPELRGAYYWPMYSAIWPFNKQMRQIIGGVELSRPEFNEEWFDRRLLPSYPHEYVQFLTKGMLAKRGPVESSALRLSISRYYSRLAQRPDRVEKDLFQFNHSVIRELGSVEPKAWDAAFLREAVAFLNLIAKTNADGELRDRASELLLEYLDWLNRVDVGEEARE